MNEYYDALSLGTLSIPTSTIEEPININEIIEENKMNSPLRCPQCWRIVRTSIDFSKNQYISNCDLNHKTNYNSFELFYENTNKDLKNLLCQNCKKKEEDFSKMFCCLECNLFFCSECKNKHTEEKKHSKFIDLNKFDNYCDKHDEPFNYFDNNTKKNICEKCYNEEIKNDSNNKKNIAEASKYNDYKKTIDINFNKANENFKMWKNTIKSINNWLENIKIKFNNYMNSIYNYTLLQLKTISFLKDEINYEKYKNNFNVFYSYNTINNIEIDNYIKYLNENIKKNYNENDNIYNMSQFFLDILNDYEKKDLNIKSKENLLIEYKNRNPAIEKLRSDDKKLDEILFKVENMEEKKYELKSVVKCLTPFDSNNYLIIGYNTGEIELCKENIINKEENDLNLDIKLKIKEFSTEISNICSIDNDKIVASDILNNIKIIQFLDNLKNYSVIEKLELLEDVNNIYTIAHLPIFSYYRNRHYFCLGDDNNLLVYKSNKMPKDLKPPNLNYHDIVEEFSIVQPTLIFDNNENNNGNNNKIEKNKDSIKFNIEKEIKIKSAVHCILEINEKFVVATCPKINCLKIYNSQNGFKEISDIPIQVSEGNNTLSLAKDKKKFIVANVGGFSVIDINNFKKMNKFHLGQKITCINYYQFPDLFVCISIKDENTYIKQYKFNGSKNCSKFSQKIINSSQKINNLINIDDRIYYLDNTNLIHFYQKVRKDL